MNIDELIDRFVERVNELPREPVWHDDVPESVHNGEIDDYELFWGWNIKPYDASAWIDELEKKLPHPFPKSFRSLVTRYIFPRFLWGIYIYWLIHPKVLKSFTNYGLVFLPINTCHNFFWTEGLFSSPVLKTIMMPYVLIPTHR